MPIITALGRLSQEDEVSGCTVRSGLKKAKTQVWLHKPVIQALRRQRQEGHWELGVSLVYLTSSISQALRVYFVSPRV